MCTFCFTDPSTRLHLWNLYLSRERQTLFEKRIGYYQKASVVVIETPQLSTMDITKMKTFKIDIL